MSIAEQKSALRRQAREAVAALTEAERSAAGAAVRRRLAATPEWLAARVVLLYVALPDELPLDGLIEDARAAGKTVALPRFNPALAAYEAAVIRSLREDCHRGRYDVPEPAPGCPGMELKQLDLALVPGVAFDAGGRRLGRGKGYYDRLLSQVRGLRVGVAFDEQVLAELPEEPHDVKLDCLATPTRWLKFKPAQAC